MERTKRIKKLKAASHFSIAVGIFLLLLGGIYHRLYFSPDLIKSIDGTMQSYSFEDGYKGYHRYLIYLNESNVAFQITAQIRLDFNRRLFQNVVKTNDSLHLEYYFLPGIINEDRNVLLSIRDHNYWFLWKDQSVPHLDEADNLALAASMILICLGGTLRYFAAKTAANTQNNAAQVTSHERKDHSIQR